MTRELVDPPHLAVLRRRRGRSVAGLIVGLAILIALGWVRINSDVTLPSEALGDFVTLAVSIIVESIPFIFLGIAISIGIQLWVPSAVLMRLLPRRAAPRRMVVSVVGVLLPVCECGNVPLARGFMRKGLSVSESMTFLLAAPILNPVTIVTTYQAFGWNDGILIGRIAGGFVVANLIGWVFSKHPRQEELLTAGFQHSCTVAHDEREQGGRGRTSRSGFAARAFLDETGAMMPALIVGAAVAAAIQVLVSRNLLLALGSDPVWSVVALMALAFVVAICSNVDAFFILSFGSTFLPGAIVAFLTFGAMIDVKMVSLLRTTFTAKTIVQIVSIVALATLALGMGMNALG